MSRIFLLSPAHCGGERATLVLNARARFDLARRVHGSGAPLGEVFSFLSGLYFRGKLSYAHAFARPPAGLPGVYVITPTDGLELPEAAVDLERLRRFASVDIRVDDARYRGPLVGSIATGKYVDPLVDVLGHRLRFPSDFVGRGDMSRGSLLLRHARSRIELDYTMVKGAERRGRRPAPLARAR